MTDREHESLMRMTKEQRLYWYRVGREQAEKGLDEPEHGRASKEEEKCWWAGWHSYAAMLPALPTDEPGVTPPEMRFSPVLERASTQPHGWVADMEQDPKGMWTPVKSGEGQ